MTLRTQLFLELVCSHIADPPARVLEVGCGQGDLALALTDRGFNVTAIDPVAPEGSIFRQVALEDFSDDLGFDAVVASLSLHHTHDLAQALGTIASFLPPAGPLVLEEFATERFAGPTARWYYEQRRALADDGRTESDMPTDFDAWLREVKRHHADLHTASTMRTELRTRFVEHFFEWHPYLYSWQLDDALRPLEQRLIEEEAIEAAGLWYVGERR